MTTTGPWQAFWTPATRPAPPLPLPSVAWRYGLAVLGYASFLIPFVLVRLDPRWSGYATWSWVMDLRHPLAAIDLALGAVAFALIPLRRRYPFAVACALVAASTVSMSALVPALWSFVSLATGRRWGRTAAVAALGLATAPLQGLVPWFARSDTALPLELAFGAVALLALAALGAAVGVRREWVARRPPRHPAAPPALAGLRAMFQPARFPPPPLDAVGVTWRYALAAAMWVFFLATYAFMIAEAEAVQQMATAAASQAAATPGPGALPSDPFTVPGPAPAPQAETGVTWAPNGPPPPPPAIMILDLALGLGMLVAMRWRRRWPLGTFLGVQAASILSISGAGAAAWALLSLSSRRRLRSILLALGAVAVAFVLGRFLPWRGQTQSLPEYWGSFASAMGWSVVLVALGMYHGTRQDRVAGVADLIANAGRDRELAVLGERNRIAREMHDVLAHRISLVSMHAGALAYRTDLDPEQTRDIARIIQENAHASLTELRAVLSTLRDGQLDAVGAPAAPQPTLVQLPALLAEARSLGQRVTLHQDVDLAAVPQVTARHAFRILQECLTNARKHAPYAVVEVSVTGRPGVGLDLRVANPLTTLGGGVPGAGLGLIGIRERATMLGGRIEAAARDGVFVVTGRLPWPA